MDLLGSILNSMDKPPTPNERERKASKGNEAFSETTYFTTLAVKRSGQGRGLLENLLLRSLSVELKDKLEKQQLAEKKKREAFRSRVSFGFGALLDSAYTGIYNHFNNFL